MLDILFSFDWFGDDEIIQTKNVQSHFFWPKKMQNRRPNSGCVHSEGRSLNTTIIEGPTERHKSRLASRETCDGLTGTLGEGSLDRTESVPKMVTKAPCVCGLREASQRDKAMRSMPPFPEDSYDFFYCCVAIFIIYNLQQQQ